MKRVLYCFLLILTLSTGSFAASAENTADTTVVPPALVQCQSDKNCDRDPKHLEQFVADFYKWYVKREEDYYALPKKFPHEKLSGQKQAYHDETEHFLEQALTSTFYTWRLKAFKNYGNDFKSSDYCSPDIDPITCSQDFLDGWEHNTSAQLVAADRAIAVLVVKLPTMQAAIKTQTIPHLISVQMRPEGRYWRIAGTIDLVTECPDSGK